MNNSDYFACTNQIGRYRIIKEIGRGGSSSVFLCVDNHIGKRWAMKLILPEGENKELFTSEIATLKSLDYYMFPRITDAFSVGKKVAIVTDYIEGENLEDYLKREGPLPTARAIGYLEELTRGLNYLHSKEPGILYLDMKPSNIMVLPTGEIRLVDFGIASAVLSKGKCYGSPGYAAPEQYVKNGILTEKTDVYALGMTALSMITGIVSKDIGKYVNKGSFYLKLRDKSYAELSNLIKECVNEDENKRPNIDEILTFLKRIKEGKNKSLSALITAVLICSCFSLGLYFILNSFKKNKYEVYAGKMINEAAIYMENGEYTYQGIRIICGYLDGNFLDIPTKEKYSYEVAKFYFEALRDYSTARHYFSFIDVNRYPEIEYYLKICRAMSGFEIDKDEIKTCIAKLEEITGRLSDANRRENNLELIGFIRGEIEIGDE